MCILKEVIEKIILLHTMGATQVSKYRIKFEDGMYIVEDDAQSLLVLSFSVIDNKPFDIELHSLESLNELASKLP